MRHLIFAILLLSTGLSRAAWNSPNASDVKVNTNNFSNLSNATVQAVLDYIDDNAAFVADGYVTTTYLTSQSYASQTNANTMSGTNTFTGQVIVSNALYRGSVSNASGIALNAFNGFKISLPTSGASTVTSSTSYATCSRLTNEVYDTENWNTNGIIYPTVAGYYEIHAKGNADSAETHVRVGISSNTYETVVTLPTNTVVGHGSALIYVSTATNYLTFDTAAMSGSSTVTNLTIWGRYLGE